MYEPTLPKIKLRELRKTDSISFDVVMEIVRHAAKQLYHASLATNALGLEKCEETILEMIDEGTAKIMLEEHDFDLSEDRLWIGYFNPATGRYQPI